MRFGQWVGPVLRKRAGKGGWVRGWGLGSTEQKGPRLAPASGLRWQETPPGRPAGFLGLSGWGKRPPLLSRSSGPGGFLPPASPDLPGLPPSYAPRTCMAWRGALEGRGPAWELSRLPMPEWVGQTPSAPFPLPPPASPVLFWPPIYTPGSTQPGGDP